MCSLDNDLRSPKQACFNEDAELSIDDKRNKIDKIDQQLIQLLHERASLALHIGIQKKCSGTNSFASERENEILKRVCDSSTGTMPQKALKLIFNEIISACREIQEPLTVAFLGPETTFSHYVAVRRFGNSASLRPMFSIADVFEEVETCRASLGIAPMENSLEGGVSSTMDCFLDTNLKISGEIYASIRHALVSRESSLEKIQTVYSHPQALNQCRNWLRKQLPEATLLDCSSTADAAKRASQENGSSAIASELAAEKFVLNVLAKNIQDRTDNKTRFVIIGFNVCKPTGQDKTTLYFTSKHRPGSLCQALTLFSERGVNLTRIESRPLKDRNWEYSFFVDCEGHQNDQVLSECLEQLKEEVEYVKVLGSYPRTDPNDFV